VKRLTLSITATALIVVLSGCQSAPFYPPEGQKTFKAYTYYGKELPSGHLKTGYRGTQDDGNSLRGYDLKTRHWY